MLEKSISIGGPRARFEFILPECEIDVLGFEKSLGSPTMSKSNKEAPIYVTTMSLILQISYFSRVQLSVTGVSFAPPMRHSS
jgi:hypothetical protein